MKCNTGKAFKETMFLKNRFNFFLLRFKIRWHLL